MNIAVCVKQIPESLEVNVDETHGRPDWSSTKAAMNPFDAYAVEEGVRLVEKHGGKVTAISVGPASAESVLREAIAAGASEAILLVDEEHETRDSWGTAKLLEAAIRKRGDIDLVLCGKQSADGDTGQLGPMLGGFLDRPQAIYVSAITDSSDDTIVCNRMSETGYESCALELPAVVTVVKDINAPRIPSLRSRMAAKKAEIQSWSIGDLGIDEDAYAPRVNVTATRRPTGQERNTLVLEGPPEECAVRVVEEIERFLKK